MNELSPAEVAERRKHRRRLIGLVMLVGAIVLVLVGQFVLDAHLNGWSFILYWGSCTIFVVLALFAALADMVAVRRDAAREARRLVQETIDAAKDGNTVSRDSRQGGNGKE